MNKSTMQNLTAVEYFGKWKNAWIEMPDPTPGKISEMQKYFYRIKINGVEQ